MSFARLQTRTRSSSAFTLVELMIVIAIVGILASLVTVGVMKGLEKARLVNLRLEIGQLEAAVTAAKLDLNNLDELPSVIYVLNDISKFSTQGALTGESPFNADIRQKTWLTFQKAFGRNLGKHPVTNTYYEPISPTNPNPKATTINWPCPVGRVVQGMEAYIFWLGGVYTQTGNKYQFQGFSTDKRNPCETAAQKRKGPYFEFDSTRFRQSTLLNNSDTSLPAYLTYVNSWDGEYAYFSSSFYKRYELANINGTADINTSLALFKHAQVLRPYYNGNVFYNAKTFQIINSGKDQLFGFGGTTYIPNQNDYILDSKGYDDMSNFSSTILGKKDE